MTYHHQIRTDLFRHPGDLLRGGSHAQPCRRRESHGLEPLHAFGKDRLVGGELVVHRERDAALQARVKAFQAKQQQGSQELQRQQQQIQLNQQYVQKQIAEKIGPIYTQVMQRRGANVMVEIGQTLASGSSLDVTNDVLTALNAALPTIRTTAPAQPQAQQQPQGR